ncbi:DNA ligase [Candidatus Norongarragalina meridionalis]|nr:DNA ligase [Candidatus Norongarragalina meridionalis]
MDFASVALVFDEIEGKTKRLDITADVAALFKKAEKSEVKQLAYLCEGILLPQHFGIELGIGDKLAEQAIAHVSGKTVKEVEASYRKTGDLGLTSEELLAVKRQRALSAQTLTVKKVYENCYRIATSAGEGSQSLKVKLLAELLSNASPLEGRMIVRLITGSMRLGVGEATIIDAWSFVGAGDKSLRAELERAFNMTSDLGLVAEIFFSRGMPAIRAIKPHPFSPIRPALAERLNTAAEIFEKLGECAVEGKYDGFRLQVHLSGGKVEIYSRKQERMTPMFPDVVAAVKKLKARELIFEGEALAYNEETGEFLPFQETITRKRKHGVSKKAEELPLRLFAFDLLYLDGKNWMDEPYAARHRKLETLTGAGLVAPAKNIVAKKAADIQKFFDECVSSGLEGVIAKDLKAPYVAGARKFAWIKLKKSYSEKLADTIDVVIVGFYYGKGKRTEFGFGGLLTAVKAGEKFRTVAKIGTGFSEAQMQEFHDSLSKLAVKQKPAEVESLLTPDVWVKPRVVVEVKADEITRSPVHKCAWKDNEGLALRFPRLVRVRDDKGADEATTEKEVVELYELQKHASA